MIKIINVILIRHQLTKNQHGNKDEFEFCLHGSKNFSNNILLVFLT